jgi:NAD(P)-dependent dehydrogenase (short-subunit alcohol dehydrogenase family)
MDLELTDKVAIITGGSRGLGFASAAALAGEGCRVAVCARGEARLMESAAALRAVAGADDRILPIVADVSSPADVQRVIDTTVSTFGRLDILVNNVGLARGTTIADTADAEWQEAIDQTLFPAIRMSRLAVPHMGGKAAAPSS